jgi:hypothetical protein
MTTLTSLLNSTIQAGETVIEEPLLDYLDDLADGTYKVGDGTLTISTTEDEVDSITGSWTANSSTLTSTEWFTGQETASQSLLDLVTGLQVSSVYFAYDTDITTTKVDGSYTSSTLFGGATSLKGTAWWGNAAAAEAAAADLQVIGLRFAVRYPASGQVEYKAWDGTQVQTLTAGTAVQGNYATTYTASTTTTTTTVDALYWDGDSVETMTFAVGDITSYATGVTEGSTLAIWDTNKQSVLGMELLGGDITLQII